MSIQDIIPTPATYCDLKKNELIIIKIPTGNAKYPVILWAIFQVSSSRIVQGNLNPMYLLKGILGEILPKIIMKIEIPIISILSEASAVIVTDGDTI